MTENKESKKPVRKYRQGNVSAAIFHNKGKFGLIKNINLQVSYPKTKDDNGKVTEWENKSISLTAGKEVFRVINVLQKVMCNDVDTEKVE